MSTAKETRSILLYLRAKSQALHTKSMTINLNNGSLITSGQGPYPQIIAYILEMNSIASNLQSGLESTPLEGKESASVAEAYKEFVRMHQAALHLLTGKAALFTTGQEVADALRQQRDILDILGTSIIGIVDAQKGQVKMQQTSLNLTLRNCIIAHAKGSK